MYAWVFWYDNKSFKSIKDVLACNSGHIPNILFCSEIQAKV